MVGVRVMVAVVVGRLVALGEGVSVVVGEIVGSSVGVRVAVPEFVSVGLAETSGAGVSMNLGRLLQPASKIPKDINKLAVWTDFDWLLLTTLPRSSR
jgi:hypothetical protein